MLFLDYILVRLHHQDSIKRDARDTEADAVDAADGKDERAAAK